MVMKFWSRNDTRNKTVEIFGPVLLRVSFLGQNLITMQIEIGPKEVHTPSRDNLISLSDHKSYRRLRSLMIRTILAIVEHV